MGDVWVPTSAFPHPFASLPYLTERDAKDEVRSARRGTTYGRLLQIQSVLQCSVLNKASYQSFDELNWAGLRPHINAFRT